MTRSWDSLATVQCFFAFWQVLVEDFGSVILAAHVAENYFDYFNEFDWAGLFRHGAKSSTAQEERQAASL